jgi:hypothetical protein
MGWRNFSENFFGKHFTAYVGTRIIEYDLDDPMVGTPETKKEKNKMKKTMKKNAKKTIMTKATLVKPNASYTKDEVRDILQLSRGTALTRRPGMAGRGKVPGTAVIAYLENAARVKVGRRYASGTVTVVAR